MSSKLNRVPSKGEPTIGHAHSDYGIPLDWMHNPMIWNGFCHQFIPAVLCLWTNPLQYNDQLNDKSSAPIQNKNPLQMYSTLHCLLLAFITEITTVYTREGAAANNGLPSEEVDRRWEYSNPQSSSPNATTLSDWPAPVIADYVVHKWFQVGCQEN